MNRGGCVRKTIETGRVTFFSRTKGRLWTKGEESGHFLLVKSIQKDCDNGTHCLIQGSTLVARCAIRGPIPASAMTNRDDLAFITYSARLHRSAQGRDARGVVHHLALQFGSQPHGSKGRRGSGRDGHRGHQRSDERLIYEASDLLYHLIVLLTSKGYRIEDLARELKKRHK